MLSVNEGGWRRGRGESNRNAGSKSRPRLDVGSHSKAAWDMSEYTSHLNERGVHVQLCT